VWHGALANSSRCGQAWTNDVDDGAVGLGGYVDPPAGDMTNFELESPIQVGAGQTTRHEFTNVAAGD
jgi:hypothetical protein